MKLTCILSLCFVCTLSASVFSQQKVSMKLGETSIKIVFEEIRKQTGKIVIYNDDRMESNHKVKANFNDVELDVLLDEILTGRGLRYKFVDDYIVIIPATQEQVKTVIIKGTVKDTDGMPLIGVTVRVKGLTVGTVTDRNGTFSFTFPQVENPVLQFSFVGMKPQEVVYRGQAELHVVLEEEVSTIEEVVITGFYERKVESIAGSVAAFSREQLKTVGSVNLLESLNTLDPAFNITPNNEWGSDPNRLPDIDIRGKTSILDPRLEYEKDPNQPLFIIDGFEVQLRDVMNLSMDRVASVNILKDAASTAIYGSQGANGVVVIETIKPKAGTLEVRYNGDMILGFPDLSDYNLMNAAEKLEFELKAGVYTYGDQEYDRYMKILYNRRLARVQGGVNTYWLKEPVRTSVTHKHHVYASGGSDAYTYGLGLTYRGEQGVMKKSGNDYIGMNIDLTYRTQSLRFSNKFSLDVSEMWNPTVLFGDYSRANPYYEKKPAGGIATRWLEEYTFVTSTIQGRYQFSNPHYNDALNHKDGSNAFTFRNTFFAEWEIMKGLNLRGRLSVDQRRSESEKFKSPYHTDFENRPLMERGTYERRFTVRNSWSSDIVLNFAKLYAEKHRVDLVGTFKASQNRSRTDGYDAIGFADDMVPTPAFASQYAKEGRPVYTENKTRTLEYFLNSSYTYDNRYVLEATIRRDGSTNFGKSNLFTNTWSLGLAWNIHKEKFLGDWANLFRLRFSVGNPGNKNVNYSTETTYRYNTTALNAFGNGLRVSSFGGEDLDWEKVWQYTLGTNFSFFNSRVAGTFDLYRKIADPLVVMINNPSSTGRTTFQTNNGRNTINGLDFTLNVRLIDRRAERIIWNVGVTGGTKKGKFSKMGSLDALNNALRENSLLVRYKNGGSSTDIYAVRSAGIDPSRGREVFIKPDGTYTNEYRVADEVVVGNSLPALDGRINTSITYKGFNLTAYFNYIINQDVMNRELFNRVERMNQTEVLNSNQDKRALYDRWQKPGDIAKFRRISDLTNSSNLSDRYLMTKNWFSGESISLSYDFYKQEWLKRASINSLNVRVNLNEIFKWSSVKQERGTSSLFDRKLTFSVNVNF